MSCACYVNNIEFIRSSLSRKSFVIFRRFTTMTTEEGTNHVTELCIYNQLTRITQIYEVFVERWWCDSRVEEMRRRSCSRSTSYCTTRRNIDSLMCVQLIVIYWTNIMIKQCGRIVRFD